MTNGEEGGTEEDRGRKRTGGLGEERSITGLPDRQAGSPAREARRGPAVFVGLVVGLVSAARRLVWVIGARRVSRRQTVPPRRPR
jgi:hypothetical protein